MKYAYYYKTKIGEVYIAEEEQKITNLSITRDFIETEIKVKETDIIKETAKQLYEYLDQKRKEFTVRLNLKGTKFQKEVWKELMTIPYGETWSYGRIAKAIGNPNASRAVGMANHNNPIMILVPCHRVVGANGCLTGYAGGLSLKKQLLDLEKGKE